MRQPTILATLVLSGALVACGGDDNSVDAAVSADARPPDAGTPDAAPAVGVTLAVHDIQLLTLAGEVDTAKGHGGLIEPSFGVSPTPVAGKANHNHSGGLAPCGASYWVAANAPAPLNEGTVKVSIKTSLGADGTKIPDCTFMSDKTYKCVGAQGAGGSIAPAAQNATLGFLTYTGPASASFGSENVGRYFVVAAGTNAGAAFPITGASGNALGLIAGSATAPFDVSAYLIVAGVGPVPATSDPNGANPGAPPAFLNDGDKVTFQVVPGGSSDIPAFTSADIPAGGHMALTAATKTLLASPLDLSGTKDLTFAVDSANSGTAQGIIVRIDATDATSFPKGATDMGTPALHQGTLTCAEIGNNSVTIEKDILGVIGAMNPTKVRIVVFWDAFDSSALLNRGYNVVAGHGLAQYRPLQ